MNTVGVIFTAEFARRLRSRAFIVGTLIGALSIVGIAMIPSIFKSLTSSGSNRLVLVGPAALVAPARPALARDFTIIDVLPRLDEAPTAAFLDAHGKAAGVVILSKRPGALRVVAYARDPSAFRNTIARDLSHVQLGIALGVAPALVDAISKVPIEVHDVSGRFADANAAEAAKGVAYLFALLLYLSIMLNAQSIMSSVAEEKTSRIAELLVATLDPTRLLAAKISASAATSFIQLGLWVITGVLAGNVLTGVIHADAMTPASTLPSTSSAFVGSSSISVGALLAFVAFFIVGFAQYGVLYAAAASLINRTEDLGSVAGPLVVPVVIGFLIAIVGLQFPSNPSIVAVSMMPLLSPFVMFTRIAVSTVPAWQIAASLLLNVLAAIVCAWLSGKIYRVGLLLYGRPPSLRQILATLRT